jgi:hypothetical protein
MKKLFFILFVMSTTIVSAQEYTTNGRGIVFNAVGQKLTSVEVRSLLAEQTDLLQQYNAGRSKKTIGNILLYGGLGLGIGKLVHMNLNEGFESTLVGYGYGGYPVYHIETTGDKNYILAIVGGAMVVAAIPVKIGFSKKIKNSIADFNERTLKKTSSIELKTSFIANQNGVGLQITF